MHLWIDHTGLHGAAKSLIREARNEYDFKGLLQFATFIVFADTIEFGDYEVPEILEPSRQYRQLILDMGLDGTALSIRRNSRDDYASACRATAEFGGEELQHRFRADEQFLLGLPQSSIPQGAQFRPDRTKWLATQLSDPERLAEINRTALDTASGAIDYMLSGSGELRGAMSELICAEPAWSSGHTFQVESILRVHLNETLARQAGADYAPASQRADVISRQNRWILDQLSAALDPIVKETARGLRSKPLDIPSVQAALVGRSNGDPKGLISEALEMRARAASLRPSLRALQQSLAPGGAAAQHQIRKEIAELARGVRQDLGLEKSSPWDALKIDVSTGLPAPMSVGSMLDWLKIRRSKGRRVVLTDVVLDASYDSNDALLRKLRGRCFARNSPVNV